MNESTRFTMTRKDLLCGAAGLAAAAYAGPAIARTAGATETESEADKQEPAAAELLDGTYTASAQGRNGTVTVEVEVAGGAIASASVVADTETADLTDVAKTVIPQAIVEAQSLAIDSVAGSTLTSYAIKQAVADCVEQAGGNPATFEETPFDAAALPQAMTPGTYTGEAYGMWKEGEDGNDWFGAAAHIEPTRVEVDVDETSILDVRVLETSDTAGFCEPAVEMIPKAIVEQQSLFVDACSGSTLTSGAIRSAAMKALEQAGANLAGFAKATPHEGADEEYDCDLVIVGAGTAGTTCALRAIEEGLKVVILEKEHRVSGTGGAASGPFAVGSSLHKAAGIETTADEVVKQMLEDTDYRINEPLTRRWVENSGRMMDWLHERWTSIGDPGFADGPWPGNPYNLTAVFMSGTPKFTHLYENFILPGGAQLLYGVQASRILTEDGAACGVEGTSLDTGAHITVHAKAVAVCAGGFGGNPAKLREYLGSPNFYLFGVYNNTGDGMDMLMDLGCVRCEETAPQVGEFCANSKVNYYAGCLQYVNQCGFLALDPNGCRFTNEELFITSLLQKGGSAFRRAGHCYFVFTQADYDTLVSDGLFGLFDEEYINTVMHSTDASLPRGWDHFDAEMQRALEAGEAFKTDTLEELGELIGFEKDVYEQTIADYLTVTQNGVDPVFGKPADLIRPLAEGPFYAVRAIPPIFGTYNGIKVDSKFRPLVGDEQKPTIKGLYVGGHDGGGELSYPYTNFLGSCSSYALTSGMLIAEEVAELLAE